MGVFLLPLIFLANLSQAQMMGSFVREQTGTLPRGRFLVSMVGVQSSIDRMYNPSGNSEALSQNFNQDITFQKIVDEEPVRGNQLSGLFQSNGVALSDGAGSVSGTVTGKVSGKVPLLGYGLRDDLGIYFALPIIEFQMNSGYHFQNSAKADAFLERLKTGDQSSVAAEFKTALENSLETKLYRAGYDWNASLSENRVGDLQVNLVQLLENRPGFKSQVQPTIMVPTASEPNLRDLYSLKAGDRRWGVGAKYAVQMQLQGAWIFNAGISGTYLFPGVQGRRLPKNETDRLNEWMDSNTTVSGGMSYRTQAQIRYPFPRWVGLNLGIDWQQRFQDVLTGSQFDARSYILAGEKTGSSLLTSYASVDLNSIQSFLDGNFLFPAQAELGVGLPWAGRNAIAEPVIQFQGTMFF